MAEELLTIVVADDEEELREAMCSLIRWEEIGFQLVGSAGNGLDALQMVEQLQPDLLLTDIQMPFITGTALARQVRELQPLIQVAFLSGYDDFEYARSAIENQVISYLLKPISMAELTAALKEIHDKIVKRFNDLRSPQRGIDRQMAAASLLLDMLDEDPEEQVLTEMLEKSGLILTDSSELIVLGLSLESVSPGAAQTVDKVLERYYSSLSIISGRRVLSLLISDDGFARLDTALDELYYVGKRLLSKSCIIGVSRPFRELVCCRDACREAVEALKLSDGPGIGFISELQANREGISLLVEQTLSIITQEFADESLTLGSVSERLHVSPNYLSANMKKYAGDTFISILIKTRMEAARKLILQGGMKIGEVAGRCGYSDQHYFSYCFKKYFGVSPVRMRHGEAGGT